MVSTVVGWEEASQFTVGSSILCSPWKYPIGICPEWPSQIQEHAMHLESTMRRRKVRPVERLLYWMELSDMVPFLWLEWDSVAH